MSISHLTKLIGSDCKAVTATTEILRPLQYDCNDQRATVCAEIFDEDEQPHACVGKSRFFQKTFFIQMAHHQCSTLGSTI